MPTPSTIWTIDRLVPGGDGFARLDDGRAAFATGAVPGDRIAPGRIEERPGFSRALSWDLVEPSPHRVEPECPVADRCGGCDLMHLARDAEVEAKATILADALTRIGKLRDLPDPIPMVTAGGPLRYRNRLTLHVDPEGRIGLFARGTHDLVEIPSCAVSAPLIDEVLDSMRRAGARHTGALGVFTDVEVRVGDAGPPATLHFRRRPGSDLQRASAALDELREAFAVTIAGEAVSEDEPQRWTLVDGLELNARPGTFTQVNWAVNREMIRYVVDGARERAAHSFCDLYAGAGNFSLPLLAAGLRGVAVERDRVAVECAAASARAHDLDPGTFLAGNVARRARKLSRAKRRFDLVLVDAPRAGARDVLPDVARIATRHVVICSCDPPTFARDLRTLVDTGFRLESVTGFDMFPRTHHVEAIAWLER